MTAAREEQFLVRITGKGVAFKRRIPGWLAVMVVRMLGRYSDA